MEEFAASVPTRVPDARRRGRELPRSERMLVQVINQIEVVFIQVFHQVESGDAKVSSPSPNPKE